MPLPDDLFGDSGALTDRTESALFGNKVIANDLEYLQRRQVRNHQLFEDERDLNPPPPRPLPRMYKPFVVEAPEERIDWGQEQDEMTEKYLETGSWPAPKEPPLTLHRLVGDLEGMVDDIEDRMDFRRDVLLDERAKALRRLAERDDRISGSLNKDLARAPYQLPAYEPPAPAARGEDDENDAWIVGPPPSAPAPDPATLGPWEKYRLAYRNKLDLERRGVISKDRDYDYVSGAATPEQIAQLRFHPPNQLRSVEAAGRLEHEFQRAKSMKLVGSGPGHKSLHGYNAANPPHAASASTKRKDEQNKVFGQHKAGAANHEQAGGGDKAQDAQGPKILHVKNVLDCPCADCKKKNLDLAKKAALTGKPQGAGVGKTAAGAAGAASAPGAAGKGAASKPGGLQRMDADASGGEGGGARDRDRGLARRDDFQHASTHAEPHTRAQINAAANLEKGPPITRAMMRDRDHAIQALLEASRGSGEPRWTDVGMFEGVQITHKNLDHEESALWRASTTIDLPPERVFTYLSSMQDDPGLLQASVVQRIDAMNEVLHLTYDSGSIIATHRDFCVIEHAVARKDNTHIIAWRSMEHPKCAATEELVRGEMKTTGYIITPSKMNPLHSLVVALCLVDAKGWMPGSVGDNIAEQFVRKLISYRRLLAQNPKRAPPLSNAGVRPERPQVIKQPVV